MKYNIIHIIAFFLVVTFNLGAVQITNEFWIHPYTNGLQNGTLSDPFDGSTRSLFDAKMSTITTTAGKCLIHLLPGTYDTAGGTSWALHSGQTLAGSGIDITVIRQTNWSGRTVVVTTSATNTTDVQLRDLTVDCNYGNAGGGSYVTDGVALMGDRQSIRRVKVINAASMIANNETFCVQINGTGSDGLIEECEVSSFNNAGSSIGGYATAIVFNGSPSSGTMKNNRVILPVYGGSGSGSICYNAGHPRNLLIDGNFGTGGVFGVYGDTGGYTNITIVNNFFRNCQNGVFYNGVFADSITVANNNIELPTTGGQSIGVCFYKPTAGIGAVTISGNRIRYTDAVAGSNAYAIWVQEALSALIADNTIDDALDYFFVNNTRLTSHDNVDFKGGLIGINEIASPAALPRTAVASNYTSDPATGLDSYIGVDTSAARTITLPRPDWYPGREVLIIDETGNAAANHITVVPPFNSISGAASVVINTAYGYVKVISNGSNWLKL